MLKLFTGDDRLRINQAIKQLLGTDYEIIEGAELSPNDLPSIFQGTSLFASTRNILIRDLSANKPVFEEVVNYLDTPHRVVILELQLDKRSNAYKNLKDRIEIQEFKLPPSTDFRIVFNIFAVAKTNGPKAVAMLSQIEQNEEPIKFCGLMISQALKDYIKHQGIKEKRVLRELSKLDLALKSTPLQPWLLIRSFLLRLSSL